MTPLESAKWLPNYVKAFGFYDGVRLLQRMAVLSASASSDACPLSIPGVPQTAWVRPGNQDLAIFQQIFVKREYDIAYVAQFERIKQAYSGGTKLIIDCGAHIGLSVLWWRKVFPEARIIAVEPGPENFSMLERNVGKLDGVSLYCGAIWSKPGRLSLTNRQGGMAGLRVSESGTGDVQAITMEQIFAETDSDRALLVKLDIEGAEADLFEANVDWLDRIALLVIEPHDWLRPWEGTSQSFLRQVATRPFDMVIRGENLFFFRH